MEKFTSYRKLYHRVVICLLIMGLIGSILMFSVKMREASSTITDKSHLPPINTLLAGSYF
jgi:hypothetical protein